MKEAGLLKQLELSPTLPEVWEVQVLANMGLPEVVMAAFEKMVELADDLKTLIEVHIRSMYWYETKFSSLRKIVKLHEAGKLIV